MVVCKATNLHEGARLKSAVSTEKRRDIGR